MDHHAVAAVSLTGICLDVLGGLYLAYDLLGGQHGPLRLLTRAVTYSIVFGIGYGIGLGVFFGIEMHPRLFETVGRGFDGEEFLESAVGRGVRGALRNDGENLEPRRL